MLSLSCSVVLRSLQVLDGGGGGDGDGCNIQVTYPDTPIQIPLSRYPIQIPYPDT